MQLSVVDEIARKKRKRKPAVNIHRTDIVFLNFPPKNRLLHEFVLFVNKHDRTMRCNYHPPWSSKTRKERGIASCKGKKKWRDRGNEGIRNYGVYLLWRIGGRRWYGNFAPFITKFRSDWSRARPYICRDCLCQVTSRRGGNLVGRRTLNELVSL